MLKLNSHQLRASKPEEGIRLQKNILRNPIVLILDNVLDTYNIGSFFRLADALGAEKIYLCGPCITPPNLKIHRSSVGTWKWLPWQHFNSTIDCINHLKKNGYQIIACEQSKSSVNFQKAKYNFPVAIIAGSEMEGIQINTLKLVDQIVEIPMYGVNKSLNTLVATSIIAFDIVSKLPQK